jgi:hypothetical protein
VPPPGDPLESPLREGRGLLMAPQFAPEWQTTRWFNASEPVSLAGLRERVVLLRAFQKVCRGCVARGLPQAQRVAALCAGAPLAVVGSTPCSSTTRRCGRSRSARSCTSTGSSSRWASTRQAPGAIPFLAPGRRTRCKGRRPRSSSMRAAGCAGRSSAPTRPAPGRRAGRVAPGGRAVRSRTQPGGAG